jgi:hypothetical protein
VTAAGSAAESIRFGTRAAGPAAPTQKPLTRVTLRPVSRRWLAAYALITLIALARVAATHRVFSEVLDEPVHLAAGYDWLSGAPYTLDASHPPLARVLSALPLKVLGIPRSDVADMVMRGNHLLYHGDRYVEHLVRARLGNLLLFAIAIAAVAAWGSRHLSPMAAFIGTALFTMLPPVLAHAGLATTDLAVVATLPLALFALDRYLDEPTRTRAAVLGLAIGAGLLSKYSFCVFFPVAALVTLALHFPNAIRIKPLVVTLLVAGAVVWSGYRFEVGTIAAAEEGAADYLVVAAPRVLKPAATWFAQNVPLPAPLFVHGFLEVKAHNAAGHQSYLLGRYSDRGFWYYFPVVWFFKTPLPLIVLAAAGAFALARRQRYGFLVVAAAIMASTMTSNINIGVRHILPIYAPLSLLAGHAVVELWRRGRATRVLTAALLAWLGANGILAHPDYLPWFNEAAGPRPERIAVDSNLDWGQDVLRLAEVVRERKIEHLSMLYIGNSLLERHGIHARFMAPHTRYRGWIAVSESALAFERRLGGYGWLERQRPLQRVGKSIRLYYIP